MYTATDVSYFSLSISFSSLLVTLEGRYYQNRDGDEDEEEGDRMHGLMEKGSTGLPGDCAANLAPIDGAP